MPYTVKTSSLVYHLNMEMALLQSNLCGINHRWASTSALMSAISDIRHRYLLFRYRNKKCRTKSFHSDTSFSSLGSNPSLHDKYLATVPLRYEDLQMMLSEIEYRSNVYSDIRYNVGLCALQSDIGRSNIRLSPISVITNIGLSFQL
jgi:hypothetical protein